MRRSRSLRAVAALAPLAALLLAGCPALDPMQRQQKVKPYQASEFHADGLAMRAPPAGTVPHGPPADPALRTGRGPDGKTVALAPVPVTPQLLQVGRKRFDVHCAVCHGLLGDGESQVALNMSLRKPPSLHLYRDVPDGYLFQVASEGFGLMPGYAAELSPEERWAVVAYLRALQLSQHADAGALAPAVRQHLRGTAP
jgi:mono/diheme cytochrome c family protein